MSVDNLDVLFLSQSQYTLYQWLYSLSFQQTPNGKPVLMQTVDSTKIVKTLFFTLNRNTNRYVSVAKYSGTKPIFMTDSYSPVYTSINGIGGLEIPCLIQDAIIYEKKVGDYTNAQLATVSVVLSPDHQQRIINETKPDQDKKRREEQHREILNTLGYNPEQIDSIISSGGPRAIDASKWVDTINYERTTDWIRVKRVINQFFARHQKETITSILNFFSKRHISLPNIVNLEDMLFFLCGVNEILQYKSEALT